MLEFTIVWLDHNGIEFERSAYRKRDLTAAINTAANLIRTGNDPHAKSAHGFYVPPLRGRNKTPLPRTRPSPYVRPAWNNSFD